MSNEHSNLYAHFSKAFAGGEDRTLLSTFDGKRYSYREVDELSARIAFCLKALGVAPGDRVSAQVEKSPQNLCLYLACLRGGFVYHPLNLGYKRTELSYFVENAEPALIVCDTGKEPDFRDIVGGASALVRTLDADGTGSLIDESLQHPPDAGIAASASDDLAALLYSSGTTGVPKGIMLTHGNLLANTEALVSAWGFTEDDRLLHALPTFHVHGLFVAIGCAMLSGAQMGWLSGFSVDEVIACLPDCTVFMGVPTYYTRLLGDPAFDAETCRSVRLFVSGSAPLLEETFADFESRTGHRILERYGMTETNMNTSNPLHGERKPGTVGPPLPGVEARVTGDDGAALPVGEIGNLQIRGPNVFAGYWRMPDKTAEDFTTDGFFNTGDLGKIDEDGYVSIVGRNKDLVITGGLNVYPKELELFIDALPGVRESAIIGVPHPDFGEGVVAVVVPQEADATDESSVIGACRTELAGFKVPKRVLFVDELPRNTMAKVQKNRLRETYAELFAP